MSRKHSAYDDYCGNLIKYDDHGEISEIIPFKFNIINSKTTTIDAMSGQMIKKGEFKIKTDSPIKPVTHQDKVQVDWQEEYYLVGEMSSKPKKHTTGRRGRLRLTMEFYLE